MPAKKNTQAAASSAAPGGPAPEQPPAAADRLSPRQDACLKVAKEIAVKFIETGRLNLASFGESFQAIYQGVADAVKDPKAEK